MSTSLIDLRGNAGPLNCGLVRRRKRDSLLLLMSGGLRRRTVLENATDGPDNSVPFGPWADAEVLMA